MADIRKRGPYQWQVRIRRKGHPSQTKTFNTKAEAEAWAQVTESEMVRGVFVSRKEAESTTLSEALDRYAQEVSSKKKGAYQESRRIENLKLYPLAKRFLSTILGKDIAQYRDERLQNGLSEATIRRELVVLSHVFEVARKEWGMEGLMNPVKAIRLPSGRGIVRERRLSSFEESALLEACDVYGGDLPHIVRLALETGMRRGELSGMTWGMVDLKKRTVTLPETKIGEKRIVPLSQLAVRILSDLPRRIDGSVWGMTQDAITKAFIRALFRARTSYEKTCQEKGAKPDPSFLVGLTFHDLRHEATSRFFEKGLNPMQVAAITGHKTLQMLKRYTHLKAEDLAKLLDG